MTWHSLNGLLDVTFNIPLFRLRGERDLGSYSRIDLIDYRIKSLTSLPSPPLCRPSYASHTAILSGKELFNYNSALFVDDDGAIDASEENALVMQTKIGTHSAAS